MLFTILLTFVIVIAMSMTMGLINHKSKNNSWKSAMIGSFFWPLDLLMSIESLKSDSFFTEKEFFTIFTWIIGSLLTSLLWQTFLVLISWVVGSVFWFIIVAICFWASEKIK
jgi:hypothetical protein